MAGRKQAAGSAGPSSVGRGLTVHRGEVSLHGRLLGEVARRTVGPGKVLLGKPFQQDSAVLFLLGSAKKKNIKVWFSCRFAQLVLPVLEDCRSECSGTVRAVVCDAAGSCAGVHAPKLGAS